MNILGKPTKTVILAMESHKLSQEFKTSADIKIGQAVKLNNDGTVSPLGVGDSRVKCIGYAYSDALANGLVTVFTRGYHIQFATTSAAAVTGPVKLAAYDSTHAIGGLTGYNAYTAATPDTDDAIVVGWLLDPTTAAGQLARVLLF